MKQALSVLAGILFVLGFFPYIKSILKGYTKPAKASWIIWATLDSITLAGMIAKHSVNGQIIGAILGAWTVVFLALKFGAPGWTKLDKLCLGGAVLGIVLWKVFASPTIGMMTSLTVVFLGSFPTFSSAYSDPSKENRAAWTIYWISCIVAVVAIPAWTPEDAAQPITFLAIESIMMWLLIRSR